MAKQCRGPCGEVLDLSGFYKHPQMADGHLNICRACVKTRVAKERFENPEKFSERDKRRYYENPNRKEQCRVGSVKASQKQPVNRSARLAVGYAIKRGDLQKKPCAECGIPKTEAHHEDYSKPLDVVWLCRKHHMERHRKYIFDVAA